MPHCDAKPAAIVLPCRRKWNEGPMQAVTTQKHDYVPKPLVKTCSYKPIAIACQMEASMEGIKAKLVIYNKCDINTK